MITLEDHVSIDGNFAIWFWRMKIGLAIAIGFKCFIVL